MCCDCTLGTLGGGGQVRGEGACCAARVSGCPHLPPCENARTGHPHSRLISTFTSQLLAAAARLTQSARVNERAAHFPGGAHL